MQFGMLANEDVSGKVLEVEYVIHETEDGMLVVPDQESVDMLNKFFNDPELQEKIRLNMENLQREGVVVVDDETAEEKSDGGIILDRNGLN